MHIEILNKIIPNQGMPLTPLASEAPRKWFSTDDRTKFIDAGGHPDYSEDDIEYIFNEEGYRAPPFSKHAPIRMISIGCSLMFGVGIKQEEIFHERLARQISKEIGVEVINWNLSFPGTSNDYIVRLLNLALRTIDPHLVIITFTMGSRRDYFTLDGSWLPYKPTTERGQPKESILKQAFDHFEALTSPIDDTVNYYRNVKACENALSNRIWLSAHSEVLHWNLLKEHLNIQNFVSTFQRGFACDKGRDFQHYGKNTHENALNAFWEALVTRGMLAKLTHSQNATS